jgi:Uma2 family endonuclease
MSAAALPRMTADEFIAWAMQRPETEHYELVAGEVVAMAPERVAHVRGKQRMFRALEDAIAAARLPCEAFVDGVGVQVDEATVYQPDALVRRGPPLAGETVKILDPLIVVDVLSPSRRAVDTGVKFTDYFRLPSVRHYLIVRAETRTIIHHRRDDAGTIQTRIVRHGPLTLDPPGLVLDPVFSAKPAR